MPVTPTYPGVYIEEIPSGVRTITGVATSITAFVGRARRGPVNDPKTINSYGEFERVFGGLWEKSSLGYAVRDFFLNGGSQAVIVRLFHPQFTTEDDYNKAKNAANQVSSEAKNAAAKPDATTGSVKDAARTKANSFVNDPEKTAATLVAKAAESAATTKPSPAVKDEARRKADSYAQDPEKTAADLVAKAAATAAGAPNAKPEDIAGDARGAADKIAKAAEDVAKAAEDAAAQSGSTATSVKDAARAKANLFANDPEKTAADLVAKAAEDAEGQAGATPTSVKNAARDAANKVKAAAAEVANFAEEAAGRITNVATAAAEAVGSEAAPLTKARLTHDNLSLEAANEGSWGNELRIRVDRQVKENDRDLFNLTVLDAGTGALEVFRNLSMDPGKARNVVKILKNESQLVFARGTPAPPPPKAHPDPSSGKDAFDDASSHTAASEEASDGGRLDEKDFTGPGKEGKKEGLFALEKADLFNLLCIPPYKDDDNVDGGLVGTAASYCEKRRAMLLVDSRSDWTSKDNAKSGVGGVGTTSKNAALFFPRLRQPNPLRENQKEDFVPCGAVAGIFARTDSTRGVWKAPAGLEATLVGVPELNVSLTDAENGELNPLGINCLRVMPPAGRTVWGARTLEGDDRRASEWKYIPVRRLALFIEESLCRGTQWVVFEPNAEPLWAQIRLNLGDFMQDLFRQGAFQGKTPREAYFVKCDKETTTQYDIDRGIVNILVGFAPLKPAEFVIIRIQQLAGQARS